MKHKIIDNFLSETDFYNLKTLIESNDIAWYFCPGVAYSLFNSVTSDNKPVQNDVFNPDSNKHNWFFTHLLYDEHSIKTNEDVWNAIQPLLHKLKTKALIRIKANCYTRTPSIIKHDFHVDYKWKQKGCIFYINTNNGLTILEDGTEIKSIENRAVILDTGKPHASTSVTNKDRRLNLNINYF